MAKTSSGRCIIMLPDKKEQKDHIPVNLNILKKLVPIIVRFAVIHYFRSDTKFESGCGWPSFYEPISKTSIIYLKDNSLGMERTEVECGRCKSHLGHVFDDGPPPTGLRYCINGVVLDFKKAQEAQKKYDEKNKPSRKIKG